MDGIFNREESIDKSVKALFTDTDFLFGYYDKRHITDIFGRDFDFVAIQTLETIKEMYEKNNPSKTFSSLIKSIKNAKKSSIDRSTIEKNLREYYKYVDNFYLQNKYVLNGVPFVDEEGIHTGNVGLLSGHLLEAHTFGQSIRLKIRCNGIEGYAVLDSGAQTNVMNGDFARRTGLIYHQYPGQEGVCRGVGGETRTQYAQIIRRSKFEIIDQNAKMTRYAKTGDVIKIFQTKKLKKIPVEIYRIHIVEGLEEDMLLGYSFMKFYDMIIDILAKKATMRFRFLDEFYDKYSEKNHSTEIELESIEYPELGTPGKRRLEIRRREVMNDPHVLDDLLREEKEMKKLMDRMDRREGKREMEEKEMKKLMDRMDRREGKREMEEKDRMDRREGKREMEDSESGEMDSSSSSTLLDLLPKEMRDELLRDMRK
jgi:hypothetical protein